MMKRILAAGAGLAALAVAGLQQPPARNDLFLIAMPLTMGMLTQKSESSVKVVTYLGLLTWSSGSTISGSINIGAVHSKKEIFLVSTTRGSAARTLTAASTTVAAVAVTKATTEQTSQNYGIACAFAATPTQSGSVTITCTYSGALTSGTVAVYSVVNRTNIGANQTDAAVQSSASNNGQTLNTTTINANGIWFGGCGHANTAATTSPATEDSDVASGGVACVQCHRDFQGSSSTPSDTWSWTGSAACAVISWAFD